MGNKNYIFLTSEGSTYQNNSNSTEPDIENLQVIGLSNGKDSNNAFKQLLKENMDLLNTNFKEIFCYEYLKIIRRK